MHVLVVVERHKSVQLLEDLDFTAVSELVGLLLQDFEQHLVFVLVDVALNSGAKLILLEKVANDGLRAHEQATSIEPLLEHHSDHFLQNGLSALRFFLAFMKRKDLVLRSEDLEHALHEGMVELFLVDEHVGAWLLWPILLDL